MARILERKKSSRDTYLQRKKQGYVGPISGEYEEIEVEEVAEEIIEDDTLALEQERLAKEAAEKAEQERLAKEAAEKAEQERLAKEAAEKAEQERLAKEAAEKAEQERLAKEAAEKAEQERLAKEAAEKAEQERLAKEAAEEEQRRLAKEAAEAELKRIAAEKLEALKREQVTVAEAKEVEDEVAEALIEVEEETEKIYGTKKGIINLDVISKSFNAGDTVTVNILKEKKLIDKNICFIKVLARGVLDKPLTIKAQDFSLDAAKMIEVTGGRVVMLTKRKYF